MGIIAPPALSQLNGRMLPPIEMFAPLRGDGVTDDSVALKAAHDAAYAQGVREVYCGRAYYAPSAYNLGNVIFRGPGRLVGVYRKKIIPYSARSMSAIGGGVVAKLHLAKMAAAATPKLVIWGDSTGTTAADRVSPAEMLWTMTQRAFLRANRGKTINRDNRSIGGTTIQLFSSNGADLQALGLNIPSWFANLAATWPAYVGNAAPNCVILNFGTNGPAGVNHGSLSNVTGFLSGLNPAPDIIFATPLPRGTQADAGATMIEQLNGRDINAAALRSYAEFYGFGLLDLNRVGCILRDGFDPCTQVMGRVTTPETQAIPATLPPTEGDFFITFTLDNSNGAAFGAGQRLSVSLSAATGNYLQIDAPAGTIRLIGYTGGGGTWMSQLNTQMAAPAGPVTISVSTRQSFIVVSINGTTVYEGLCYRAASPFQPVVSYVAGAAGAASITGVSYVSSTPMLTQPSLTDVEMFGVDGAGSGGNGINHPASAAYEAIHSLLLDRMDLSLALAA